MKYFNCRNSCHFGSMNPAERLDVIRARLKHPASVVSKPSGMSRAANPDAPQTKPRKPYRRNEAGYPAYSYSVGGEYTPTSDNRPPWVYQPDKPKPVAVELKRTERPHHLTKIAEKWLHAPKY